jgi:hypothetical protein
MKDFHFCSKCGGTINPVDDVVLTPMALKAVSKCCFVTILVLKEKPGLRKGDDVRLCISALRRLQLGH